MGNELSIKNNSNVDKEKDFIDVKNNINYEEKEIEEEKEVYVPTYMAKFKPEFSFESDDIESEEDLSFSSNESDEIKYGMKKNINNNLKLLKSELSKYNTDVSDYMSRKNFNPHYSENDSEESSSSGPEFESEEVLEQPGDWVMVDSENNNTNIFYLNSGIEIINSNINDVNEEKDEFQCVICLDRRRNTVHSPCGHLSTCMQCTKEFYNYTGTNDCIICQKKVSSFIGIYL